MLLLIGYELGGKIYSLRTWPQKSSPLRKITIKTFDYISNLEIYVIKDYSTVLGNTGIGDI